MFEFRVTKYDPRFRSPDGTYTRDEWTSVSDIGRSIGSAVLTQEEYDRTESAYLAAAGAFLTEAGQSIVRVHRLEDPLGLYPEIFEGATLQVQELGTVLARALREELWCKFEAQDAFVHVGHDYYMYIGVPHSCPLAQRRAVGLGLFVESHRSPYHDE